MICRCRGPRSSMRPARCSSMATRPWRSSTSAARAMTRKTPICARASRTATSGSGASRCARRTLSPAGRSTGLTAPLTACGSNLGLAPWSTSPWRRCCSSARLSSARTRKAARSSAPPIARGTTRSVLRISRPSASSATWPVSRLPTSPAPTWTPRLMLSRRASIRCGQTSSPRSSAMRARASLSRPTAMRRAILCSS